MEHFSTAYMIALRASIEASEKIMEIYLNGFDTVFKHDGSPVTQADLASSEIIDSYLHTTGIPITGEETEKISFQERSTWSECWCVDPLDGTKEFVKQNGEFSINIALIRDQKPVFGLIASPVERQVLFGGIETGVFCADFNHLDQSEHWERIEASTRLNDPIVMTSSRSHSGTDLQFIKELKEVHQEVNFIKKGSALKFFNLVRGEADVYPRFAPTMEWDIAAGQALLEGVGGSVYHAFKNEPLRYNKENLMNPYFIARTKAFIDHGK